jgi:hypothetical protein
MIRDTVIALALVSSLLSAPAHAQQVLPLDRPVVLPPVSAPELRDAERLRERTPPPIEEKRLEQSPVGRDNPGLGYDVTTGIQQRTLEKALPR